MSRLALYQKYRSQTFDEVIGQDYIVRSIKNAVRENKVGHAYLFCGPRGTGKTTMARLLARAVNCENPAEAPCGHCDNCKAAIAGTHPDIIEINAANETHVEDIRDLIERSRLAPMMGKHKVYIIDEVHQLSTSASSALLKTLEEPPEHVIFILATTDPQKLLNTIISRCQRFDFSKVDTPLIKAHLLDIAGKEGFKLEDGAAEKIAQLADGGMRDALSILEQASAYADNNITEDAINEIFGLASTEEKTGLLDDIFQKNLEGVLNRITNSEEHGIDLKRLCSELAVALKDGVIWKYTGKAALLRNLNEQQAAHIAEGHTSAQLLDMVKILMDAEEKFRTSQSAATIFEIACMDLMTSDEKQKVREIPLIKGSLNDEHAGMGTMQAGNAQQEEKPVMQASSSASFRPAEPQQKPEQPAVAVEKHEYITLSVDDIVAILAGCDKPSRADADEKLKALSDGLTMNKYIAALNQMNLAAAGKDSLLFTSKSEAAVNVIDETKFNQDLYEYLKENGIDKMPFAIKEEDYKEAVKQFVDRMKSGTLPEPRKIERWKKEEVKEETPEEKVMNLFGKENVTIVK